MNVARYFDDIWSIISFVFLLVFMGLFYQVAWQYPVNDAFPLIERLIDPNFLKQDFYTNTFEQFSPRLATAQAIVSLSEFFHTDYMNIIAYGNILRIWLYGIALYLLFLNLSDKKTALIAFAFSSLSFLSMPFLPAWWPISYDLTSSNIALVFAMFSWVFSVRGSVKITIMILALTVHIHPVVGVQSLLICIILYLSTYKLDGLIKTLKDITFYPIAAIFSAVFLITYFSYDQTLPSNTFIEVNGKFRHAHHFELSHMEFEKWVSTILMGTICLGILLWFNKVNNKKDNVSLPILIYSSFMVLLGYFFAELFPTRFMISFIPMRAFPILVPIIMLAFARLAVDRFDKKDYISFFILFLPFLPYNHTGLTWYLLPNEHEMVLPIIMTIVSMILVGTSIMYRPILPPINKFLSGTLNNNIGLSALPIAALAFVLSLYKFDIYVPNLKTEPVVYEWLNTNTAEDSIIVSELNAATNQKIRLVSKRSVVVSKDFPFNENFYVEWMNRYIDVYEHRDVARGRIDSLSSDQLNSIMDKYKATHLIRTEAIESKEHFKLIGKVQGEVSEAYIYKNINLKPLASL